MRYNLHRVWDDTLVDELIAQMVNKVGATDNPASIARALLREARITIYADQPAAAGLPLDLGDGNTRAGTFRCI